MTLEMAAVIEEFSDDAPAVAAMSLVAWCVVVVAAGWTAWCRSITGRGRINHRILIRVRSQCSVD